MELRFNEAEIAFRQEVRDFIAKELPKETHERMLAGKSPSKARAAPRQVSGVGAQRATISTADEARPKVAHRR